MTGPPVIAVLATLDTKGEEAQFVREELAAAGGSALLLDMGVLGTPAARPDVPREDVARAGGTPLAALLADPTRQKASPVMIAGAVALLQQRLARGELHGVLGLGGTQGTSNCSAVMQALPYGLPKIMVSTVASGDCSSFVGIKDVTMMFSVSDILGLNALTRKILANAAGAAVGMARSRVTLDTRRGGRPLVAISNLGVLTEGAMRAQARLQSRGCETIVFHAIGAGGRAMEQMMKEGLVAAVFDYAMGELTDELFHGLRAANAERFTVAGKLGLPQVVVPGGSEHVGLLVPANTVPERWAKHRHVFHNPIILAPRLSAEEFASVAREACRRLGAAGGPATLMFPAKGTSRYGVPGGPLHDPAGDAAFLAELKRSLPKNVELVVRDAGAEDPVFVDECVDRLVAMVEAKAR
jgi:uncharacterized protein (UPF0261 family)